MPGGIYPGGKSLQSFAYTHQDPETEMAATIFHELLHLWWYSGRTKWIHVPGIYEQVIATGHGIDPESDIEPAFLIRLKEAYGALDQLENKIKKEAKEKTEKKAPPPTNFRDFDPGDISEPEESSEPSIVGGRFFVSGGVAGGFGTKDEALGTGIIGADLLLGKIWSFGLGGRGVYLTPDHLLAGPVLSFQGLLDYGKGYGPGAVDRPLFFDVEAGILMEIPITDAQRITKDTERITEDFAGYISAGISQEIGTSGPRFYMRLGGFAVISDLEGKHGGGGTLALGGRF